MISVEEISNYLEYNLDTGIFTWKWRADADSQWNGRWAGKKAGTLIGTGYRSIRIHGKPYRASRVAWALKSGKWPEKYIDHINGQKDDNRWCNLREATNQENVRNQTKLGKNNTSGVHGVSQKRKLWRADIRVDGHLIYLGSFVEIKDAKTARKEAEEIYFGEFAPQI